MSDNTTINLGSGGDAIATDDLTRQNGLDVSSIKVQRMKVGYGADGTLNDVSPNTPLPIGNPTMEELLLLILMELRIQSQMLQDGMLPASSETLDRLRSTYILTV